ncbi:MAG: PIN domain nuclease [Arsenicicoccus sp.]|uniref:type II toxin-antitoxin system VapC family toxin n=1 Tax=Serinicoccus profundi TaxID=1078471 RepID=UPI000255E7D1|nr:type II toxin-antitoxin system VapC family toxin [Serinicoccus profundi]PZU46796.1 MAG: PIN domain nuclease [Arsenicicoccus sp.]
MRYLLDTNVVVWLLLGDRDAVPPEVAEAISDPHSEVLVSAASAWEIAIKRSLGKLRIGEAWRSTLGRLEVDHLPVTLDHAAAVEHLPWHHRDPFDRLLLAQAQVEGATLVTSDRILDRYDVATWWGAS